MNDSPGFFKEWLADHRILCYRLQDIKRETIDRCLDDLNNEMGNWSNQDSWRLLLDDRNAAEVSSYTLRRIHSTEQTHPDLTGRVAVVCESQAAAQAVSMLIRSIPNDYRSRLVFVKEKDAVAWLLEDDKITPS